MTNDTPDKKPSATSPDRSVRNDFDIQRRKRALLPSSTNEELLRSELADQQILIEEGLTAIHEAYFLERGTLLEQRRASSEDADAEWTTITEWTPGSIVYSQGLDPNLRDSPSPTRIVAKGDVAVLALTIDVFAGNIEAQRLLAENERRARFALVRSLTIVGEFTKRSWRAVRTMLNPLAGAQSEKKLIQQLRDRAKDRNESKLRSEDFNSRLAVYRLQKHCVQLCTTLGASAEQIALLNQAVADALNYDPSPRDPAPSSEQPIITQTVVVPSAAERAMPESHRSGEFPINEPGSTQQMPVYNVEQLQEMAARQEQQTQVEPPATSDRLPDSTDVDELLAHSERTTTESSDAPSIPKPPSSGFAQELPRPPIPRAKPPAAPKNPPKIEELILDALTPELKPKVTSAPPTVRRSPRSLRPGPDKPGKK